MPTPSLSAEKIERIRGLLAAKPRLTFQEIATLVGVGIGTVHNVRKGKCKAAGPPPEPVDPIKEAQERQDRTRKLQAEREALNAVAGERSFRALLESLLSDRIEALPPCRPPVLKPLKTGADCSEETMLLHLSDWHFAERVLPEGVFGLNEYNRQVGVDRVRRITESVLKIKHRLERGGGYRFPRLVIAANGDFVSGTIHEVEKHTDAANVVDGVLHCADTLAGAVHTLANEFERVVVFGTAGNHGRLPDAKKVQTKEPTRSWDYLIYRHAAARLSAAANVEVITPPAWAVMYEIEGKLIYQGHGHFVKSWNSIPFYGINRLTARLSNVLARHFRPVDYWLFGHFHTRGSIENAGGEYLINPSLIGPQEFGIHSMGEATAPGQSLMSFNKKHGKTFEYDLHGEESWPPKSKALGLVSVG